MDALRWIGVPPGQDWYLAFAVVVMVGPPIVMARWYHRNVVQTPGGRALMQRQNRSNQAPDGGGLAEAGSLYEDIMDGRYSDQARSLQRRVLAGFGIWLAANVVVFGLLIWAQEVARTPVP